MGDPKKQRRKYETPRHPWRESVLREELSLLGTYGLRNKRELWRHKTELTKYRDIARFLLGAPPEARAKLETELLNKLGRLGLVREKASIDDVLDLTVEDILERRLQTKVFRMGLARSPYEARQLINHGHIYVAGRKITSPSYLVLREEEKAIEYSPGSPYSDPEHPLRKTLTAEEYGKKAEAGEAA